MRIWIFLLLLTSLTWAERFRVHHRPAEWLVRRLTDKFTELKFVIIDEVGIEVVGDGPVLRRIQAELAVLDQEPMEQEVEIRHADLNEVKALLTALEPDTIVEEVNENHLRLIAAPAALQRALDLTDRLDAPPDLVAVECRLMRHTRREEGPRVMRWTDDPEERIAWGRQLPNLIEDGYLFYPELQTAVGLSGQELKLAFATSSPIAVLVTPTVRVDGYVLMKVTVEMGVGEIGKGLSKFTSDARIKDGESWWCSFGTIMLCFTPNIRGRSGG